MGADTGVLRLPAGAYVTSLSWSPGGTALAFDLSQLSVVESKCTTKGRIKVHHFCSGYLVCEE